MGDLIHTGETVIEMQERVVEVMRQRAATAQEQVGYVRKRERVNVIDLAAARDDAALAAADYGRALRVLEHMRELQAALDAAEDMSKEED